MEDIKIPPELEWVNLGLRLARVELKLDRLMHLIEPLEPDYVKKNLNVTEVSKLCKVSPGTIYNWVSCHKIPCRKLHGRLLFSLEEIEAFIHREIDK